MRRATKTTDITGRSHREWQRHIVTMTTIGDRVIWGGITYETVSYARHVPGGRVRDVRWIAKGPAVNSTIPVGWIETVAY